MRVSRQKFELAMARAGLTSKELCERSGISHASTTAAKTGRVNVRPFVVGRLAKALGVDPLELLQEEGMDNE